MVRICPSAALWSVVASGKNFIREIRPTLAGISGTTFTTRHYPQEGIQPEEPALKRLKFVMSGTVIFGMEQQKAETIGNNPPSSSTAPPAERNEPSRNRIPEVTWKRLAIIKI